MEKLKVTVTLRGCDDRTDILIWATPGEVEFLDRLAAESQRLGGGCMPTLIVTTDAPEREVE